MKVYVSNGEDITGIDFLLTEEKEIIYFRNKGSAIKYLKEMNYSEDSINNLNFIYVMETKYETLKMLTNMANDYLYDLRCSEDKNECDEDYISLLDAVLEYLKNEC